MKAKEAYRLSMMNNNKAVAKYRKDKYFKYILSRCRGKIKEAVKTGNFSTSYLFSSYSPGLLYCPIPKYTLDKDEEFMRKLKEKVVEPLRQDGYEVRVSGFMWPEIEISWSHAKSS